eukprot:15430947-Alexandrium_andersonii.AAC.2
MDWCPRSLGGRYSVQSFRSTPPMSRPMGSSRLKLSPLACRYVADSAPVSYTHLRAHETSAHL